MLGKDYFENRLKDIYHLSIIDYLCGNGILIDTNGSEFQISWELCVDLSGKLLIVLTGTSIIEVDDETGFIEYSLEGETLNKEYLINCARVFIYSASHSVENGTSSNTYFCDIQGDGEIQIYKQGFSESQIIQMDAYLTNFLFRGLEKEQVNTTLSRNKFSCKADNLDVCFRLLDNHKEIKDLIEQNRIQESIFSTLQIKKNALNTIEEINDEIEKITYFLSFLTLNTNFSPIQKYFDVNGNLIKTVIKSMYVKKYQNSTLLNNSMDLNFSEVFNTSYSKYKALRKDLNLDSVINMLFEMQSISTIEIKLAILIMAYEALLTKYLINNGFAEEVVIKEYNIQQKIQMANKTLKFIPSHLSGDNLRAEIRNPLFHQGEIPFMNFEDIYKYYTEYFDLIIRIIFRIIEYNGKFISRNSHASIDV